MAIKNNTFEKLVFKELDFVRKTYLNKWSWIRYWDWKRRVRTPKLIHIYWWESFFRALDNNLDSNPLMRIILDTIWKSDYRYHPIYSRNKKWYRARYWSRWPETFYDTVNCVWDYAWHKIDFWIDEVVWWYPPILTWLFVERPHNEEHWDLLIYLIKQRYASKKINSSETTDWGTES